MKKLYILLLFAFSGTVAGAQLELHMDGQSIGNTLAIDSATVSIDHFQQDFNHSDQNLSACCEIC